MVNETRVGYATIDAMLNITMDYIKAHTINNKYVGEVSYLLRAYEMREYLK